MGPCPPQLHIITDIEQWNYVYVLGLRMFRMLTLPRACDLSACIMVKELR